MEITPALSSAIREKRKELNLSLNDVKEKSKSVVSVSALSAIERGELTSVKDETFQKIASILNIDVDRINTLRIAFGSCAWASVLISAVVNEVKEDVLPYKKLQFTCYGNENGLPQFLTEYNQNPNNTNYIFTANETLNLLQEDKVDIAFLPKETSERGTGIVKIARSMNTVRGGVFLYIITNSKNQADLQDLRILQQALWDENEFPKKKCCFVYPLNSIAQYEVNNSLFMNTYFPKIALEVGNSEKFKSDIDKMVKDFLPDDTNDDRFFVFVGWDFHINILKNRFDNGVNKNFVGQEFDSYLFTKKDLPIALISYDCVTTENKADYIRNSPGLKELFQLLLKNINTLNQVKLSNNNSLHIKIADFLNMDKSFINWILKQIHWEFLIYPEIYDKNLK